MACLPRSMAHRPKSDLVGNFVSCINGIISHFIVAATTFGALSPPPASYIIPTRDCDSFLVMLAPVPIDDDHGKLCVLPTGDTINLRAEYQVSGFYKIGSNVPLWSLKWFEDSELVRLSSGGRYVVRVNRFGGGDGIHLDWAIRFYDSGKLIKSYGVGELIDFPSLMKFTSADWHHLWIDEGTYGRRIEGNVFRVNTSTRDEFEFDIRTGNIISESRYWITKVHLYVWIVSGTVICAVVALAWRRALCF